MGANVSTAYDSQASPKQIYQMPPPMQPQPAKKGQVIAFHSSAKWKLHFEAVKQTSKLVYM